MPVRAAVGVVGLQGSFGNTGIDLGGIGLTVVLAVMFASYMLVVGTAGRLSPLLVLGAIAAPARADRPRPAAVLDRRVQLPVLRPDRAGVPRQRVPGRTVRVHHDPLYPYIGSKWVAAPTVYGPLFTGLSYLLAPLTIPTNVFAYKAIAAVSSLAVVALVWNGARLRGIEPVKAAALVGLNPLIVVYGVGGGHNDLLMLVPLLAGIVLLLQRHGRLGAGSIVVGAGIKVTAGLLLPFALAGARGPLSRTRRRDLVIGAGVTGALLSAFAFVLFGAGPLHLPATIENVQSNGNWQSIPGFIGTRLGLGTVGHPVTLILVALFAVALAWLLWRVWQGQLDWIAGAGWATFALLVTAASLLPWYVAWLIPLAALARDGRLWKASIVLTGIMGGFQLLAFIPHGSAVGL